MFSELLRSEYKSDHNKEYFLNCSWGKVESENMRNELLKSVVSYVFIR
jgi:hypothetical protein